MKQGIRAALLVLVASMCMPTFAASDPWGDSPFTLQLGTFRADTETTVRLDSTVLGRGTQLSFENDLGVTDSKALPEFSFLWRINQRHGIEGSFVTLNRSGSRTLDGTIQFGDAVFPVSTTVNAKFDSDVYRVAYRYSPINDKGNELALLLGAHYTTFDTAIASSLSWACARSRG